MLNNHVNGVSIAEVHRLCDSIELLFKQHCGAVALDLVPATRQTWSSQYQPRLATVIKYVDALSTLIPDTSTRKNFKTEASHQIISRR